MKNKDLSMKKYALAVIMAVLLLATVSFNAQSQSYPDALLTTPGTPEVIEKGLETDGYALGVLAYTWGYPVVRMERVAREYTNVSKSQPPTSYRASMNRIGWAKELATSDAKDMPTANNDTLYMSSIVQLDVPYILEVPDTDDRYYVVDVFNMWHQLEHYIGRRTTGTKARRFVLVPPGWKGDVPSNATRLDVTTHKVWLWGRLRVVDGENIQKIHTLQAKFKLTPVGKAKTKPLAPLPEIKDDPLGFLHHLAFALKENPIDPSDQALFAQLERIGLTKGTFAQEKLNPAMKRGLAKGIQEGPLVATASFASSSLISRKQGWDLAAGLDDFGFNYPFRTMIAGPYLGGQGEKEAIYPIRFTDSDGKPLSGKNKYIARFEELPPVDAFWSLTIYNAEDKMLVENPISRFKIGGDTPGFTTRKKGYFEIPIQHEKPQGEFAKNWLPAPKGNFYLLLRYYQPIDRVFTDAYKFPELKHVR